ncbi:glycerophosphodiester phosphodiesterase family protein [Nocardioides bigeumensis]|uniref:glycerophosphodiester phosphodiesterase family protein n=1 Tax=Nocardioides bigeumensis TaxID=433657 RepID=UPI0031D83001
MPEPAGRPRPRVIAHRGASGERPEHTRSAYALAAEQGADGLEVDVVSTKDGVLVCRHEHQIGATTDVADHPGLADRRTTRTVPGRAEATGWFVEDLTYAELRTLRARERMPRTRPSSAAYDGRDPIPTLADVIDIVSDVRRSRPFSLWVELKHPAYLASLGLGLVDPLLAALESAGLDGPGSDVVLESFEPTALETLSQRTALPLMQLLELADKRPADLVALGDERTYGDLASHAALDEMAPRIAMLGVHTTHVFPIDPEGATGALSSLVDDSHARGIEVAAFTLRRENRFLPRDLRIGEDPAAGGDLNRQVRAFVEAGADALITDHPGEVRAMVATPAVSAR